MKNIYLVEFIISQKNALYGLQKILLDEFPWNFYIWSATVNDACMQKIKIGHRANFRAKYKCFPQILFPVRAILRSINVRCTDFITDSADACIWHLSYGVCRLRACAHLKTLSSLLNVDFHIQHKFLNFWTLDFARTLNLGCKEGSYRSIPLLRHNNVDFLYSLPSLFLASA